MGNRGEAHFVLSALLAPEFPPNATSEVGFEEVEMGVKEVEVGVEDLEVGVEEVES